MPREALTEGALGAVHSQCGGSNFEPLRRPVCTICPQPRVFQFKSWNTDECAEHAQHCLSQVNYDFAFDHCNLTA